MTQFKLFLSILLISSQVTAQQDSVFFTSNYFSHNFFERWPDYDQEEIMRRADFAANEAFRMAYEENNLHFKSVSMYNHFLGDGLYMDVEFMQFVLAGVAASSGNPEPLGKVNELRSWNKTPQTIFYIPDQWTISATDTTSPFEYAAINEMIDLSSFEDVRMNIVLMKESNLTTNWEQDSTGTKTIWQIAHGAICHNDGYGHDNNNCNLHTSSAAGLCFTIPDDRVDQVRDRAQWRCNAFDEVRLEVPLEVELCEDGSELIVLDTNVDDVQFEVSSGVQAIIIDDQLELQATADGSIELWATDGTIDTVRKTIQVSFLENEMRDAIVNLSQGEELMLADGTVVTEMGTYTAIEAGAAENGCDIIWNYEVNVSTSNVDVEFENDVLIYPNPFDETLTIDTKESFQSINIYSMSGEKIYADLFSNTIDTKELSKGLYIIELKGMGTENVILKVFKNN